MVHGCVAALAGCIRINVVGEPLTDDSLALEAPAVSTAIVAATSVSIAEEAQAPRLKYHGVTFDEDSDLDLIFPKLEPDFQLISSQEHQEQCDLEQLQERLVDSCVC